MDKIAIDRFLSEPGAQILAFPKGDTELLAVRYAELNAHAIDAVYRFGPKLLHGFPVLGLGRCGVVILGQQADQPLAIKIRRMDATHASLAQEAKLLAIANTAMVGPTYYDHSSNFLLMAYLVGPTLLPWLKTRTRLTLDSVRSLFRDLLEQAFRLDQVGLNHGNLRCLRDHVIVTPTGPMILDFSSATLDPAPTNVAHLTQGLFLGSQISAVVQSLMQLPPKGSLVAALRQYKDRPNRSQFDQLIRSAGLSLEAV